MKKIAFAIIASLFFVSITTSTEITTELLYKKSEECRKALEAENVYYYYVGKNVTAREILLCAYSAEKDEIALVRVKVRTVPVTQKNKVGKRVTVYKHDFTALTPGYQIERTRGQGITRWYFKITRVAGEELVFLDGKHAFGETKVANLYFPYDDVFLSKKSVLEGARFFFSMIKEANQELCELGVRSRAYPGELLCEVFDYRYIAAVAFIEQSDDGEFSSQCPDYESLHIPKNRTYASCPEYAVHQVLTHVFRNREKAFSFVGSSAGAQGLMQFMNSKKYPTYRNTARNYPDAKLIPDFEAGMADMKNSIKAAICYLDEILSSLPESARREFKENFRLGGLFTVVGYNGGPGKAIALYRALHLIAKKSGVEINPENFKAPQKILKKETTGYADKYINIWPVIDKLVSELEEQ